MLDALFYNYIIFLEVFSRVTGMIIFNPFLGRKNVPATLKAGLSFVISVILFGIIPSNPAVPPNLPFFVFVCVKEIFIGFLAGFIMQLFLSGLLIAGEFIDLQLGVGMSKIYDPQSNVSMPLVGSLLNLFYTVSFFVSGAHLTFFKIVYLSFDILPLGNFSISPQCGQYAALLFTNILILAVKISLPIVAIEIVTEIGLGALMRAVPQINVFVVGFQLKLIVGFIMIILVCPVIFGYFDAFTDSMFNSVSSGLNLLS